MKERHKNIPAVYFAPIRDGQVLLLRRFNTGYEDGNYSMVSGHVDPMETFTEAMIREAKEEAGIILTSEQLQMVHVLHRHKEGEERVDVFFTAENWEGEIQNMEPHKCDDLSWFSLEALPDNIIPYLKEVLSHMRKGNYYSEFGWDN